MIIRRYAALVIILLAVMGLPAMAQPSPVWNAADIKLQLKKLDTLASVLYIAAHPDDENTRLLGYLAKEKLYRTGYLSLTRGDGGQNLVGNEQSELLGLIRTQELLAARRIDGAEQFFYPRTGLWLLQKSTGNIYHLGPGKDFGRCGIHDP
jgi:hypothetical protein